MNFNYCVSPWPEAGRTLIKLKPGIGISPNGRLYTKQGRGQPGRAPCLGGASAAASGAPRPHRYLGFQIIKAAVCTALLAALLFCALEKSLRRTPGGHGVESSFWSRRSRRRRFWWPRFYSHIIPPYFLLVMHLYYFVHFFLVFHL